MKHVKYLIVEHQREFIYMAVAAVIFISVVQAVEGSSSEWSNENIDALVDCTDQGYDDGQNNQFDHNKFRQCEALSESIDSNLEGEKSTYYEAFINGCIDAGNTRETCEDFTDD